MQILETAAICIVAMALNWMWPTTFRIQRRFFVGISRHFSPTYQFWYGVWIALCVVFPCLIIAFWLTSEPLTRSWFNLLLLWALWDGGADAKKAVGQWRRLSDEPHVDLQKFYRWTLRRSVRHLIPLMIFAVGGVVLALLYRLIRDLAEQWPTHSHRYQYHGCAVNKLFEVVHRPLQWGATVLYCLAIDPRNVWQLSSQFSHPIPVLSAVTGVAFAPEESGRLPRVGDANVMIAAIGRTYGLFLLLTLCSQALFRLFY